MKHEVSVIVPVYNASSTLERCIESIVLGEFKDIEVILIEDRSNDNSWDVCLSLSKRFPNVRCYQNEKNSGVSFTRNRGLEYINSKYVMFVDSDDWVSGKYIKTMLKEAEENTDSLVICGLHYIDKVLGNRRKYLWDEGKTDKCCIDKEQFFSLVEQFLIQQLWNKIFITDIILNNDIKFDESQSMGEDFEFVLDYMQAAKIQKCTMINQPLYYYVRANNSSLMSKFGLSNYQKTFRRFDCLLKISGSDKDEVKEQYQKIIQNTKDNLIYQIVHSNMSKKDKLLCIENLVDNNVLKVYQQQQIVIYKEKLYYHISNLKKTKTRINGKLQRIRREFIISKYRKKLLQHDVSIISQNCIGGTFYHDMGLKFLSPTINLYFKEPDFVRFVENLQYYLNIELEMYWKDEYPVGKLDDISIYFMHYNNCYEAKEAWNRRKKRINWDKILIIATDMEGFDEDTWKEWNKIKYSKILFTVKERNTKGVVYFPKYKDMPHVPDLIPNREYYKNDILIKTVNGL